MKKAMKLLAAVLCLVLVIGVIPVQAASSLSLTKNKRTLYLGGCTGKKANGTKAKYYSFLNVTKVLKGYDSKTMDIKLESDDTAVCTTSNKKARIYAKGRGSATVTVTVREKSTEKVLLKKGIAITVKKNADKDFTVTGIEDGAEYNVDDSITVKMPRKVVDDDYRKLTCSSSDVTLKKTGSYGSAYKVTFKKAGTYTIDAVAYMSNSYTGATAKKSFTVTVKGSAEPTPTPTPTTTPTPTPTEAPASLSVKQTALDTIVISGLDNAASIKSSDIKLYTLVGNVEMPRTGIKEVKADGNDVVVTMYSNFEAETVFYVNKVGSTGAPASFKSVTCNAMDIDSIGVSLTRVNTNELVDLGIKYFNKDGVDITSGVKALVAPALTMIQGGIGDAYASGTSVYFLKANVSCVFEISVYIGNNDVGTPIYKKQNVAVTSYEPQATGIIYTVKSDNGVYLKSSDTVSHSITYDAVNPVLEVLFVYTDEAGKVTYKTLAEEGVTGIKISDEKIMMAGVQSATGGWGLKFNNTGKATVIFYKGDKPINTVAAEVTVLSAAKATTLTATVSKANLNVNGAAGDSLTITATVKDQYGNDMKGQAITIEQTDGTKTQTGIVSFGGFDADGKLTVPGSSVILNTGKTNGIIVATVKCGTCTPVNIQFNVADFSEANLWALASDPEAGLISMDTAIKPGDSKPQTITITVEARNGAYMVKNEMIKFYPGKQPTAQIKASDLGVAEGTKLYIYTIQKDGKFLDTLPDLATDVGNALIFKSFDYQKQLEAGNYVISAYSLVAGSSNSSIATLGQRTIVVTNGQAPVVPKQIKDSTTATTAVEIVKDCFEFYINGTKLDSSAIIDAEINTSGSSSKYVKTVKIQIVNDTYGVFVQTVTVDALIK